MALPDGFEAWQAWLALAAVLVVLELFSLDLVLVMLAVGALVGMGADLLGADVWLQVLAAVAASTAALGLVRPSVVRRLHSGPALTMSHERMVGQRAVVVQEVGRHAGLVDVGGELWTARLYDADGAAAPVGRDVEIFQVTGATVLVHVQPELD